jgi:hypothetical protein
VVDVGALEPFKIKIIGEDTVDPAFGTGALGVTPAHSAADFEMYQKQKAAGNEIGFIQVIGEDGKMTMSAGKQYAGLSALEARKKFVGSIAQVRREAAAWSFARYLPKHGVVTLAPGVALVGVDGWGDCRYGNHNGSPVVMNDFFRVRELRENYVRKTHRAYLRTLGKREGERLEGLLKEAVVGHRRVIVATHVPPFEEATWHDGKPSGPDHTPFFACKSTGEALLGVAAVNQRVTFTVLCGHVHGGGIAQKGANLVVRTGAAAYGFPQPQEPLDL